MAFIHVENKRAFFGPFNSTNDIDSITKKAGCPYYNKFIGIILKWFRLACKIEDNQKAWYFRKSKIEDWLGRHGNYDKKSSYETRIRKVIDDAVKNLSNNPSTVSSTTNSPTVTSNKTLPPTFLSQETKEEIKRIVKEKKEALPKEQLRMDSVYARGKYLNVFEHEKLPNLLISTPVLAIAEGMIASHTKLQQIVQDKGLTSCLIPPAELILDGDQAIFVIEKVNGIIDTDMAREISELEYEKIDSDQALLTKWTTIFSEAATCICETYYDVYDWGDIMLTQKGLAFVKFREIRCSKIPTNLDCSIAGLLRLAPYQLYDTILDIATNKYGASISSITTRFPKETRVKELTTRTEVRKFHSSRSINLNQPIEVENRSPMEKLILEKFNNSIDPKSTTLITQRTLVWQPFKGNEIPTEKKFEFEEAIMNLKKDRILCTYEIHNSIYGDFYTPYTLYF